MTNAKSWNQPHPRERHSANHIGELSCRQKAKKRTFTRVLAVVVLTLLTAIACSSDDDESSSEEIESGGEATSDADIATADDAVEATASAAPETETTESAPDFADEDEGPGADVSVVEANLVDPGRQIVFSAEVSVTVDNVAAAEKDAIDAVEALGGQVFGQQSVGGTEPSSVITFRIRPANFSAALDALGGIGDLVEQSISTEDVTERVVDTEARIAVAELSVERLRNAMENTTDLERFAQLEQQLVNRESELEVLRGTVRSLRDRVDLSTIVLRLSQDEIVSGLNVVMTSYETHDGGNGCPGGTNLTGEADQEMTLCIEITNSGETPVTELAITDAVLDIENLDDVLMISGSFDRLEPGESAIAAFEWKPERNTSPRLRVSAKPVDETTGNQLPSVTQTPEIAITVTEVEDDPGFSDGLGGAVSLLSGFWVLITVVAGFVLPLIPVLLIAFVAFRFQQNRRAERRSQEHVADPSAVNTPPPPTQGS